MKLFRITLVDESQHRCLLCGAKSVNTIHRRGASYIERIENLGNLTDMIKDGKDAYMIEPVEMTEEDYRAMPEFTGF